MNNWIRRIEAYGIYGRLDIKLDFDPEVNVIYGSNGKGKTTLLHILANVLNADFERFAYLNFEKIKILTNYLTIEVELSNSFITVSVDGQEYKKISIKTVKERKYFAKDYNGVCSDKINNDNDLKKLFIEKVKLYPAYFPAFRTIIDAGFYRDARLRRPNDEIPSKRSTVSATLVAQKLFGNFVPDINYPSTNEIERDLLHRLRFAEFKITSATQNILSEVFIKVFASLSPKDKKSNKTPEDILKDIKLLLEEIPQKRFGGFSIKKDVYDRLRQVIPLIQKNQLSENAVNVLTVYHSSLIELFDIQKETYKKIEKYLDSVNEFLEDKYLDFTQPNENEPQRVVLRFKNDNSITSLRTLSSGERHILSMIYSASYINRLGNVVLIDEPEISLHVDWQRVLLKKMSQQLGNRQIIVCTHSPEIGADYQDKYLEF